MKQLVGGLCLAGAAAIWGGTYVVSKYVLAFIPPMTLVVMRFLVASIVLGAIILLFEREKIDRKDWKPLALYGLVGYTVSIGAQFIGTALSSAHMGAVITSSAPAFIALFAFFMLKERMDLRTIVSLVVATAGVLIVIGSDSTATKGTLSGNLFLVVAAVSWALYSVMGKSLTNKYKSLTVTFWACLLGTLFTSPIAVGEAISKHVLLPTESIVWWGVIYLSLISTALAFFLWTKGFELMNAGTAGLFIFVQPVVGAFLGWLILRETLNWMFFVGSGLIIVSVLFSMRTYPRLQSETESGNNVRKIVNNEVALEDDI